MLPAGMTRQAKFSLPIKDKFSFETFVESRPGLEFRY